MRFVKFHDSKLRLVGLGIQWGEPLTVFVKDRAGRILGGMLNYGQAIRKAAAPVMAAAERTLQPVCEQCHQYPAVLWCRTHALYVCDMCIAADVKHATCDWLSIAALRQHRLSEAP
jgi:hypothetical protein